MLDTVKFVAPCRRCRKAINAYRQKNPAARAWNVPSGIKVPGRYGATNAIVRASSDDQLEVETSLPKFLFGHNVFGPNRLTQMCCAVLQEIARVVGLTPGTADEQAWAEGRLELFRIDLACSFLLRDRDDVSAILGEIVKQLEADGQKHVVHKAGTGVESVYVGKSSRLSSCKFYGKLDEVILKGLPQDLPGRERIERMLPHVLRLENVLRARKLTKMDLRLARDWTPGRIKRVLRERLASLNFRAGLKVALAEPALEGLSPHDKGLYGLWLDGGKLAKHMHERALSRLRQRILSLGVDIGRDYRQGIEVSLGDIVSPQTMRVSWPRWARRTWDASLVHGTKGTFSETVNY